MQATRTPVLDNPIPAATMQQRVHRRAASTPPSAVVAGSPWRCSNSPQRNCRALAATQSITAAQVALTPPPDFNFRALVQTGTRELVASRYPQLLDLVDSGTLVAWQRPAQYVDRRASEGYCEPELIFLIGTAHVSTASPEHVARVVEAVNPQCVVVELCRSRSAVMAEPEGATARDAQRHMNTLSAGSNSQQSGAENGSSSRGVLQASGSSIDEDQVEHQPPLPTPPSRGPEMTQGKQAGPGMLSLSGGEGRLSAVLRSAALGGQSGLLLRLLLSSVANRTARELEVQGGAEFLAARRAAESVDAQVVLGDRPIEITLQRAWSALGPAQQLRLSWDLVWAGLAPTPQPLDQSLVESLKSDDSLGGMVAALGRTYPQLLGPLLHERDAYLAWSLKRSKAVNGAACVVGVMGAGHLRGVVYALATDNGGDTLRFEGLVGGLNRRQVRDQERRAALLRLGLEVGVGALVYGAWVTWSGTPGQ